MGQYDDILRVKRSVEDQLFKIPGVTGVGMGLKEVNGELTDQVVIRVYVKRKLPESELEAASLIPNEIQGHKTDVVESGDIEFLSGNPRKGIHRPMVSGIQVTRQYGPAGIHASSGTLGCFVYSVADTDQSTILLLSNAHVLRPRDVYLPDDLIYQPESGWGYFSVASVDSQPSQLGGTVDAAVAKVDSDIEWRNHVYDVADITGVAETKVGDTVKKSGRTTGVTTGTVKDIDYTTTKDGNTFTEQIVIRGSNNKAFCDDGDSGSLILNSKNRVVGLLWGSDGINGCANKFSNVLTTLNVRWPNVPIYTGTTNTPPMSGNPWIVVDDGGFDNNVHIVYKYTDKVNNSNKIADIWWNQNGGIWDCKLLSDEAQKNAPDGTTVQPIDGDPFIIQYGGSFHVVYRDINDMISDIYFAGGKWQYYLLSGSDNGGVVKDDKTGQPATNVPKANGDPYIVHRGANMHVVYRNVVDKLSDIWFKDGNWLYTNLSDTAQQNVGDEETVENAKDGEGDPRVYIYGGGSDYHIVYRDSNNKMSDIWWSEQQGKLVYQVLDPKVDLTED